MGLFPPNEPLEPGPLRLSAKPLVPFLPAAAALAPGGLRFPAGNRKSGEPMDAATTNVIESYSGCIPDAVQRLRFQRSCLTRGEAQGGARRGFLRQRIHALEIISETEPFSRQRLRLADRALLRLADHAGGLRARLLHGGVLKLGAATALALVVLAVAGIGVSRQSFRGYAGAAGVSDARSPQQNFADVWLVEQRDGLELYSNGLTISNEFLTHTGPRSYPVFDSNDPRWEAAQWRSAPVGLVYHTTESDLADFEAANNSDLLHDGRLLLQFLRREQLYNFLIDRFGRVHRIVPENEYAFHAGYSIWSDEQGLYLGLNQSFLGVALETLRSPDGNTPQDKGVTAAQLRSTRLLTEWLRHEFRISTRNSVAHEMVSVNPDNMLIGYHTDWAGRFPFEAVGLPDNYRQSLPSVALLGFGYDEFFLETIGGRLWPGITDAEQAFQRQAARQGVEPGKYRARVRKQYLELVRRLKRETPAKSWAEASL